MRIPITHTLTKSWEELDRFQPYIIEEVNRSFTSSNNYDIAINRTKKNKLSELTRIELLEILRKISKEAIIFYLEEKNFPRRKLKDENRRNAEFLADSDFITVYPDEEEPIYLRILPEFKNWYAAYQLEKNQRLEDLDRLHIENVYNTVLDIDERLQINPSTKVRIKLNQDCRFQALDEKCDGMVHRAEYRQDALTFLTRRNIITDIEVKYSEYGDNAVHLSLNLEKFQQFRTEIAKAYKNKGRGDHLGNEIRYTVTYNEMTGEISINSKVFKKTNFDSLTDNLFTFLSKNPNRKIMIEELRKATGKTITDLPKIIENAGFTGNLLRAFFRVSKEAIYFRQHVTKADLENLNISSLNLTDSTL